MENQARKENKYRTDYKDNYFNFYLREARINAGYTMKRLAEKVGISKFSICAYERLTCIPDPITAEKIGRALKKCPFEIFPQKLVQIAKEINKERRGNENKRYFNDLKERVESGTAKNIEKKKYKQLESLANPIEINKIPRAKLVSGDNSIENIFLEDKVGAVLSNLTYREREVVKLRYGLSDGYIYTLKEIGEIFKVTRERVRQIEARAVGKLQSLFELKRIEGFLE